MDRRRMVFFTTSSGVPEKCEKCGGKCKYKAQGVYECVDCKHTMMDDYGKVRVYLDEHGRRPAAVIADETGVSISTIQKYLRDGQLEIPEGSSVYVKCEKCGTDIRYGIYCPSCAAQLSKDIQGTIHMGNIGEKPKNRGNGQMRFLGSDRR